MTVIMLLALRHLQMKALMNIPQEERRQRVPKFKKVCLVVSNELCF